MIGTLRVEGVSAGYDARRPVLHDITLPPLAGGDLCALVGPNGAGKSTLLHALAGLLPCTGTLRLDAIDLASLRPPQRSRLVAFMPQTMPPGIGFTVLEGLMAATGIARPGPAAVDQAVALLERIGILSLAHRSLARLSGGQAQLASLAQALVREPRILLLDEPTSALDLGFQLRVMELVSELAAERGLIVIAILHDLGLAARWAETMVMLKDGRVVAAAPPSDALTPDLLRRAYGVDALIDRDPAGHIRVTVRGLSGPRALDLSPGLR